jgi:hypothetical protein
VGACFPRHEIVTITICDEDGDDDVWEEIVVNDYCAFLIETEIPSWANSRAMVAVKAWIDFDGDGRLEEEDGELQACWPLYIR